MKLRIGSPLSTSLDDDFIIVTEKDLFKGVYVLGATGTGKSNFMAWLAEQTLDHGTIVLDPHGGFAKLVASYVEDESRLTYVDYNNHLVINPLRKKGLTKSQRVNEFVEVLNAIVKAGYSNVDISLMMANVLREAVRVMPEEKLEIKDIYNFFLYDYERAPYRDDKFWNEYDQRERNMPKKKQFVEAGERLATRLSVFEDEHLNKFVSGENQFDVEEIAKNKKVVCFNLHEFDEEVMAFLGNLITHAVRSYYLHEARENGNPLFFYVDQFHSFITPFFGRMITDCRKYNIGLCLSHHNHSQVKPELLDTIIGNSHIKVILGTGHKEAERMGKEINIKPENIMGLGDKEAYVGVGRKTKGLVELFKAKDGEYIPIVEPEFRFMREGWFPA